MGKVLWYVLLAIMLPITSAECAGKNKNGCPVDQPCLDACATVSNPNSERRLVCVGRCVRGTAKWCHVKDSNLPLEEYDNENLLADGAAEAKEPLTSMVWIFNNRAGTTLNGGLYDNDSADHWIEGPPGKPNSMPHNTQTTMTIRCHPGKKICYGFENPEQDRHWGIGRKDLGSTEGCTNCCWQCGESPVVDLTY
jgi:hypothetical protein